MKLQKLSLIIALCAMMMFSASAAFAVNLVLEKAGSGKLNVKVDASTAIAGASFSIRYPSTISLIDVDSTFFETFTLQKTAAGTWTGDTSVAVDGTTYDQPLIYGNAVTATDKKVMPIAAARFAEKIAALTDTLFTLTFQRNTGVTDTTFLVEIIATTLNNTAAGYSAAGETIDLLIGADPTKQPTEAAAFPVKLAKNADPAYVFETENVDFLQYLNGDFDGDGSVTAVDAYKTYQASTGAIPLTDMKGNCDFDGGGISSLDAFKVYQCSNGTFICNP